MSGPTVQTVLEQATQLASQIGCTTEIEVTEDGWDVIIRRDGSEARSHYSTTDDPAKVARRLMQQRYAVSSASAQS